MNLFRVENLADDEGKNISDEFFAKVIAESLSICTTINFAAKIDGGRNSSDNPDDKPVVDDFGELATADDIEAIKNMYNRDD